MPTYNYRLTVVVRGAVDVPDDYDPDAVADFARDEAWDKLLDGYGPGVMEDDLEVTPA